MAELLLRATAALAIVSGLIYLSGHLLKKAQAAGLIRAVAGERRIKLLETARLGPDSYLHLVQVDDRTVSGDGPWRCGSVGICVPVGVRVRARGSFHDGLGCPGGERPMSKARTRMEKAICRASAAAALLVAAVGLALVWSAVAHATPLRIPGIQLGVNPAAGPREVAGTLQILALLTVLSLAPAILLMMTSLRE